MAVPGPSPTAGIELSEPVAAHIARSAARELVASVFDVWDDGDTARFVSLFTADGRFTDPSGESASDLQGGFEQWRAWEPWSIHWLSNEEVAVAGAELTGTWLWSSASNIGFGATPAWAGGDLRMVARSTELGWKIAEFTMTDRYRTPYRSGWLADPMVAIRLGGRDNPSEAVPIGRLEPARTSDAPSADAIDDLHAGILLRSLMWGYIDDLETRVDGATAADRWTVGGTLELISDGNSVLATGPSELAKVIEDEEVHPSAVIRVLFSGAIAVDGDRARCRWRDLWTAYRDAEAVWLAHNYEVQAVRRDGEWKFDSVVRRRVLDCPYDTGWSPSIGATARQEVGR